MNTCEHIKSLNKQSFRLNANDDDDDDFKMHWKCGDPTLKNRSSFKQIICENAVDILHLVLSSFTTLFDISTMLTISHAKEIESKEVQFFSVCVFKCGSKLIKVFNIFRVWCYKAAMNGSSSSCVKRNQKSIWITYRNGTLIFTLLFLILYIHIHV